MDIRQTETLRQTWPISDLKKMQNFVPSLFNLLQNSRARIKSLEFDLFSLRHNYLTQNPRTSFTV